MLQLAREYNMNNELKEKLNHLLNEIALLTASCEGNMHHERTIINEAIFQQSVKIQSELIEILDPAT